MGKKRGATLGLKSVVKNFKRLKRTTLNHKKKTFGKGGESGQRSVTVPLRFGGEKKKQQKVTFPHSLGGGLNTKTWSMVRYGKKNGGGEEQQKRGKKK